MKNSNKIQWLVRLAAAAGMLAFAAGCQDGPDPVAHGENFAPPDEVRAVHEYVDVQAANAARADATLRKYHFDNGTLNSLGEERLESILKAGDSTSPLVLYLDLHDGDAETTRSEKAVVAYLKDHGLTDEQIKIAYGPNPAVNTPVAPLLAAQAAAPAAAAH